MNIYNRLEIMTERSNELRKDGSKQETYELKYLRTANC